MKAQLLTGALVIDPETPEESTQLERMGVVRCVTRFDSNFFPAIDQCQVLLGCDLAELYRDIEMGWNPHETVDENYVRSGEGYGFLMLANYSICSEDGIEDVERRFGPNSEVRWVGHMNECDEKFPMALETLSIPITFDTWNRMKSEGMKLAEYIRTGAELFGANA